MPTTRQVKADSLDADMVTLADKLQLFADETKDGAIRKVAQQVDEGRYFVREYMSQKQREETAP